MSEPVDAEIETAAELLQSAASEEERDAELSAIVKRLETI
jgi:hypothetical protein